MFFSIVIPVYNVKKYLAECVESILSQSFTDYEIILSDDGSTDGSSELCDALALRDGRIKVLHNENGGLPAARNRGIRVAAGEYLIFVDSDDFFISDSVLEKIHGKANSDIVLYKYGKFYEGKACPEPPSFSYSDIADGDSFDERVLKLVEADSFFGMAWMKAVKRELIDRCDGYFMDGIISEDIDWNYKIYLGAESLSVIDESFVAYRQRENSITSAPKIKSVSSLTYILGKWTEIFEAMPEGALKKAFLGSLAKYYANALILYSRVRDKEKKKYKKELKSLSRLLSFGLSSRPKRMKMIYRTLGFGLTVLLLSVLDRSR